MILCSFSDDDVTASPMKKPPAEHIEDIQEEHRKILETIENALQKLNSERTHICEQHKEKVQQLTDKLMKLEKEEPSPASILDCRIELLQAKREMVAWNKSNKKTQVGIAVEKIKKSGINVGNVYLQVDITVKQISALQIQSDAKKTDLQDFVSREVAELKDHDFEVMALASIAHHFLKSRFYSQQMSCQNVFESEQEVDQLLSNLSMNDSAIVDRIKSSILKKRADCERTDIELAERERILKENINEIAQLDEAILSIEEQLNALQAERVRCESGEETKKSDRESETAADNVHGNDADSEQLKSCLESPSCSPLTKCQKPESHSVLCSMRILRQTIAAQKALIMKKLELNNCDKQHLDEEIAKLQQLQKQYYAYEKDVSYTDEMLGRTEYCLSDDGDLSSEDILRGPGGDSNSNSGESRDYKEKSSAMDSDDCNLSNGNCKSYRSDSLYSRSQLDNNCN